MFLPIKIYMKTIKVPLTNEISRNLWEIVKSSPFGNSAGVMHDPVATGLAIFLSKLKHNLGGRKASPLQMTHRTNILGYVSHTREFSPWVKKLYSKNTIIIIITLKNFIRHPSICMLRLYNLICGLMSGFLLFFVPSNCQWEKLFIQSFIAWILKSPLGIGPDAKLSLGCTN